MNGADPTAALFTDRTRLFEIADSEQARRRRNQPVPLPLRLPARVIDVDVVSHDLASYDRAESEAP